MHDGPATGPASRAGWSQRTDDRNRTEPCERALQSEAVVKPVTASIFWARAEAAEPWFAS